MDRFAVAGNQYLNNRNGIFYLNLRVPTHLVDEVGTKYIRPSLGTSNITEAKRLRNVRLADIEKQFREAEQRIAIRKGDRTRIENMSEGRLELVVSDWVGKERTAAQESYELYLTNNIPSDNDFPGPNQALKEFRQQLALLEAASSPMRDAQIANMALKCAVDQQLSLNFPHNRHLMRPVAEIDADEKSKAYRNFLELVRKGWCEICRFQIALWSGDRHRPDYEEVMPQTEGAKRKEKLTLDRLIELHETHPKKLSKNKKLQSKYDYIFRLMREVIGGDKEAIKIDRDDCMRVAELLMKIPPNATKKYPGLTFHQIAQISVSNQNPITGPLMNIKTYNSHVFRMSAFFKHAVVETRLPVNPAMNLGLGGGDHEIDDKLPFAPEELVAIFTSWHFSPNNPPDDRPNFPFAPSNLATRYWVSIIALYHGMRANEICQLRFDKDICETKNISYFKVQVGHPWQRIKNKSAKRNVPFHPELSRLGFDQYLRATKHTGSEWVFPDLADSYDGYFSRPPTRWINEVMLPKLGIKEPDKSFHSFRHNFQDSGRNAGLTEINQEAICGRDDGRTSKRYGSRPHVSELAAAIEKISYKGMHIQPYPRPLTFR